MIAEAMVKGVNGEMCSKEAAEEEYSSMIPLDEIEPYLIRFAEEYKEMETRYDLAQTEILNLQKQNEMQMERYERKIADMQHEIDSITRDLDIV